jgi:putative protease
LRMITKPELLAPAGSPPAMRAAVENGADAVYLGGKCFSARAGAENFSNEEFREALDYAHGRGVKVYVTVNTLVDNREFGVLAEYLFFLYQTGTDALLVQDLGVIDWIRHLLPDFPLHASTQMTVHNHAGVDWLAAHGFSRVILARETSLADMHEIHRQSPLELEVFVHGALCFCYSGQCLFSSMVGGRSGNRGACAQPCRLTYQVIDEEGREIGDQSSGEHLISSKDLMLLPDLPALMEAGIASLKIEGRMKRPEYVATAVRIYRAALDRAYADPQHYQGNQEEIQELAQIFNRDFTSGYLYEKPGRALIGYAKPNNRGLALGRVTAARPGRVVFKTHLPLQKGDGLEFWTSKGGREGLTVHQLEVDDRDVDKAAAGSLVEIPVHFLVREGDRIFKTHDQALIKRAEDSYQRASQRRVPLSVRVQAKVGQPLQMEGWDAGGRHLTVTGSLPGEKAIRHPLTAEVLRDKIDRMGNTPFYLADLEPEIEPGVIFPVSEINNVRRLLTDAFEQSQISGYRRLLPEAVLESVAAYKVSLHSEAEQCSGQYQDINLAVSVSDLASLQAALESGATTLYFGGSSVQGREPWTRARITQGVELCRAAKAAPYLIIPRIWPEHEHTFVDAQFDLASEMDVDGVLVGDLGGLKLAGDRDLPVVTDFSLPAFNDLAVRMLLQSGARRVTLSPEMNREQLDALAFRRSAVWEMLVHGAIPLMISEHCVVGATTEKDGRCSGACRQCSPYLKDRRGYLFPLQSDQFCRMTMYNARVLCLVEQLGEILGSGGAAIRLELRAALPGQVSRITAVYRKACTIYKTGGWDHRAGHTAWDELLAVTPQGMTRGHYLRGVLNVDNAESD